MQQDGLVPRASGGYLHDPGDVGGLVTHPLEAVPGLEDQGHETKIRGDRGLPGHDHMPAPFHIDVQPVDSLIVDHYLMRKLGISRQEGIHRVDDLSFGHLGHIEQQDLELIQLGVELAADLGHPNRPVM